MVGHTAVYMCMHNFMHLFHSLYHFTDIKMREEGGALVVSELRKKGLNRLFPE